MTQALAHAAPQPEDPVAARFRSDVLGGLRRHPRRIPPKHFYDVAGSRLFDQICALPEYYLTRAELGILERAAPEIARLVGPRARVVELGSGNGLKIRCVLDALDDPVAYVPVDICASHLTAAAGALAHERPALRVQPVCADFTAPLALPATPGALRTLVFFPGSTLGNLEPAEALLLLRRLRRTVQPHGALLAGVDLKKDPQVIERAYNDERGVTAAFNLNLLARINRELGGDFDAGAFSHQAFYAARAGRVEMHLQSRRDQSACVAGQCFGFRAGETIHTENSYKYAPEELTALAASAGWSPAQAWQDDDGHFGVFLLRS